MKRLLVAGGIVCAVGLLLLTIHVLDVLGDAGAFDGEVTPRGPEPVRVIDGFVGGTEDIVFRSGRRELFVSSADFRNPSVRGAIYLVSPGSDGPPRDVTPPLDSPFAPHGIDLWADAEGERLFVVNHRRGSGFTPSADELGEAVHTIEVFDVAPDGALTHAESIVDPALHSPNDVAATGRRTFYVTNDHGTDPGFFRAFEDWLRLPLGNVVHYDGGQFRVAWSGTRYANGIAHHPEDGTILVAETTAGVVTIFEPREDGTLELVTRGPHFIGADNLDVDASGAVWVGAHPRLLDFVAYAEDPTKASPSAVHRFWGQGGRMEDVWIGTGRDTSASSVAALGADHLVVGFVFEPRLVVFSARDLSLP